MIYKTFEELPVWKLALKVTKKIYDASAILPWNKDFGLRDQIRRAVVSISSNIVEGFEKRNNNEFARYLKIAKGSAGEVKNQLYIALSVGYVDKAEFENIKADLEELAAQIGGLMNYLEAHRRKKTIRNS